MQKRIFPAARKDAPPPEARIVFEDENLIVVDKPAEFDVSRLPAPLYTVHRLDAEASGLMVLARDRKTAAALKDALSRGGIERQYLAIVDGVPRPAEGGIELRIGRAREKSATSTRQKAHPTQSRYGQPATTFYRLLKTSNSPSELSGTSLLWLRIETECAHQIRVHLSTIGHAIVGDPLYGGRPSSRLHLHASRLCLNAGQNWPIPKSFTSSPPSYFGAFVEESQPATRA